MYCYFISHPKMKFIKGRFVKYALFKSFNLKHLIYLKITIIKEKLCNWPIASFLLNSNYDFGKYRRLVAL